MDNEREEKLKRAREILIEYDFSHHALYDNRINLGVEVPQALEEQWKREYYEELAKDYSFTGMFSYELGNVPGYGVYNNNSVVMNAIYKSMKRYPGLKKIDNANARANGYSYAFIESGTYFDIYPVATCQ